MKYKDIITLLVSALFLVIAWIVFNIYHNLVISTTPEELKKEIVPISPTFDQSTIDKLNSRARISPIYDLAHPSPQATGISVTPEITKEPQSSASSLIASPGGGIVP